MEQVWVKEGICDKRRLEDEGGQIGKGDKGTRGQGEEGMEEWHMLPACGCWMVITRRRRDAEGGIPFYKMIEQLDFVGVHDLSCF